MATAKESISSTIRQASGGSLHRRRRSAAQVCRNDQIKNHGIGTDTPKEFGIGLCLRKKNRPSPPFKLQLGAGFANFGQ
jgi:hypothetical protein